MSVIGRTIEGVVSINRKSLVDRIVLSPVDNPDAKQPIDTCLYDFEGQRVRIIIEVL